MLVLTCSWQRLLLASEGTNSSYSGFGRGEKTERQLRCLACGVCRPATPVSVRTSGPCLPKIVFFQAELRPDFKASSIGEISDSYGNPVFGLDSVSVNIVGVLMENTV